MQPNTQENSAKSAQESRTDALPYDVPDYLGLEAAPQKPKKSKILLRLTLFLAPVVLLVVAGSLAYWYWQQNTPEAIFQRALENSMQTKYVKRTFNFQATLAKATLGITAESDLLEPTKPKSKLSYTYEYADIGNNDETQSATGEIIIVNSEDFIATLSKASKNQLPGDANLNQWYRIDNPNINTVTTTAATFDYFKIRDQVNTVYGIIPMGNFSATQSKEVLDAIKTGKVYGIKSATTETEKGVRAYKYTVSINYPELNNILAKISTLLNIEKTKIIFAGSPSEITVWIDSSTQKIIKTAQKSANETAQSGETRFQYPDIINIKAPENVIPIE